MPKERLDVLMVGRCLAESRERAKGLILSGSVLVAGVVITKAGQAIDIDSVLELKVKDHPYASRGGVKLEKALADFKIILKDKIALDVGSSTGGFTDCLLQKGIKRVHALDVGYGLIHWKLRSDPRVILHERVNIRYFESSAVSEKIDLIVIDLSFISLKIVLPVLNKLFPEGEIIALIKPQFEVGKGEIGRSGVVREKEKQEKVIEEISNLGVDLGYIFHGLIESPIKGQKGNKEFFVYFKKK